MALPSGFIQLTRADNGKPLYVQAYSITFVQANTTPTTLITAGTINYSVKEAVDVVLAMMASVMSSASLTG